MTCVSCHQEIHSNKSGFILCPHCGTVNVSTHPDRPSYTHSSGIKVAPRLASKNIISQIFSNRLANIALASLVILVSLGLVLSGLLNQPRSVPAKPAAKVNYLKAPPKAFRPTQAAQPVVVSPRTTPAPVTQPASQVVQTPTLDSVVSSINQQLSRYGVVATITPPNNSYTYSTWTSLDNTDLTNIETFATYLTQEFSKYPIDLVANSGLKTIGLVKSLIVSGGHRAAAPAPSINGMLYDINSMDAAGSAYAREVISHEYWHYLDYRMRGTYYYDDPAWDACNPPGFHYGSGGISAYNPDSGYVAAFHPTADFITEYSTYGEEEDRAEMFGWLMYSPSSVKSLNDSGINCKTSELTNLVHQLSPEMSF